MNLERLLLHLYLIQFNVEILMDVNYKVNVQPDIQGTYNQSATVISKNETITSEGSQLHLLFSE
jgi:hypothetical protein